MDTLQAFIIIGVAGLIHASFQLSVSVMSLLSSHTLGKKHSQKVLRKMVSRFVFGAFLMTFLLVSSFTLGVHLFFNNGVPPLFWAGTSGLLMGLGISVWLLYYRPGPSTELWLPRGMAQYLIDRIKATKKSSEAFSLGLVSIVAEILFIVGSLLTTALLLVEQPPQWQATGLVLYTFVASLPLMIIAALIAGGHSVGSIQKWRERNKRFLQFVAGAGLILLGFYLYVDQISAVMLYMGA